MNTLSADELNKLARRIASTGAGIPIDSFLAALGLVVVQAMMQLEPEDRMPGCISWIAMLTQDLTQHWNKRRAN